MNDGLRLPEGLKLVFVEIERKPDRRGDLYELTIVAIVPAKYRRSINRKREYRVNVLSKTLKEAFIEAGKFLDEGLGLDIQLQVKMPI